MTYGRMPKISRKDNISYDYENYSRFYKTTAKIKDKYTIKRVESIIYKGKKLHEFVSQLNRGTIFLTFYLGNI